MFATVHAAGSSLLGLFTSCTTFDSTLLGLVQHQGRSSSWKREDRDMGRVSEVVEVVQPDSIQLLFCLDEHPLPSTHPDRGDVMFAPADMWESKGSHVYILSPVMELSLLHVTMSADQREGRVCQGIVECPVAFAR
eukprot:scaffold7712_cov119-Isochrysis_galbana.AAC.9